MRDRREGRGDFEMSRGMGDVWVAGGGRERGGEVECW